MPASVYNRTGKRLKEKKARKAEESGGRGVITEKMGRKAIGE